MCFVFFFSSRRRHTRFDCDWSSNVCSSDLQAALQAKSLDDLLKGLDAIPENIRNAVRNNGGGHWNHSLFWTLMKKGGGGEPKRSEERRVGKEGRSRWSPYH